MIFISLGSNLGNRKEYLEEAMSLISEKCTIVKKSSIIETKAMYFENQPDFLNMVVLIETKLQPLELLNFCQEIETQLKRVRTIPNGPRTIDIDLLTYNNIVLNTERLTLPHPRMEERDFVMKPLREIL